MRSSKRLYPVPIVLKPDTSPNIVQCKRCQAVLMVSKPNTVQRCLCSGPFELLIDLHMVWGPTKQYVRLSMPADGTQLIGVVNPEKQPFKTISKKAFWPLKKIKKERLKSGKAIDRAKLRAIPAAERKKLIEDARKRSFTHCPQNDGGRHTDNYYGWPFDLNEYWDAYQRRAMVRSRWRCGYCDAVNVARRRLRGVS